MSDGRAVLPPPLRGVRAAFVSLTRLPVGGFPYRPADFAWATAHAPLVGAVVGFATGLVFRWLTPVGGGAAAFFAVAFSMLVTGAFHEDGLADTCDALGGAQARERVFAILKDSRVGAFGAAALVVSIGTRALLVARLGEGAAALVAVAGALARVGPVVLVATLPYVTPEGTSKSGELVSASTKQAVVAAAWGAVVIVTALTFDIIGVFRAVTLVALLALTTLFTGLIYMRRAGGVTGDFLGATEQVGELAALAALAWAVT